MRVTRYSNAQTSGRTQNKDEYSHAHNFKKKYATGADSHNKKIESRPLNKKKIIIMS